MIVHLNGWPGVGKLTVGRAFAQRLRARLIDNHLLHDVAIRCAGIDDPDRWPLYERVRTAAYESLAHRPATETFVMTNALCVNTPREVEAWNHVVDLAMTRSVALIPVVLEAAWDENVRRARGADRLGRKLTDPNVLEAYLRSDRIQRPAVPELLVLDVTTLAPEAAAEAIARHIETAGAGPASDRHRVFA